jgi:hypothetical protein
VATQTSSFVLSLREPLVEWLRILLLNLLLKTILEDEVVASAAVQVVADVVVAAKGKLTVAMEKGTARVVVVVSV